MIASQEDQDVLAVYFRPVSTVAYILSLGVVQEYRRVGIASLLLDSLIRQLTTPEAVHCKALFLHVLTSNSSAIRFYENRNFK
ncbi:unnamed protein product [Notodromas monacha]|nr:unnamed protein product [Notodromas monacha]CAG0925429.1 unnamed protein product [Notodromas monacha]